MRTNYLIFLIFIFLPFWSYSLLRIMQVSPLCVAKFPFSVKAQLPTVKTKESMAESTAPKWAQKTIALPPYKRGCHLVTPKVLSILVSYFPSISFFIHQTLTIFQIAKEIEQELSGFKCGLAHLFCEYNNLIIIISFNFFQFEFELKWSCNLWCEITVQHTSASLTINENYDTDVRDDTETFLNRIVPEVLPFTNFHLLIHWSILCYS